MRTPTKMVDGPHVLIPSGGTPRTVDVSGGGNMLVDGDITYTWNNENKCYEAPGRIMRFWVEGQNYAAAKITPPTSAEAGTWS